MFRSRVVASWIACTVLGTGCASQRRPGAPSSSSGAAPSGMTPCSPTADGAPRLIIRRAYLEDDRFRLVESKVTLDGKVIFASADESRLRNELEIVHDAPALPGRHEVKALHRLRGHGVGVWSYMNGYRFEVSSTRVVDVQPVGGTCFSVILFFKADESLPFEELPAIRQDEEWGARSSAATRTPDELEAVRSACQQPSDACVQRATQVLKTHPDFAVQIFAQACHANIARGCVELGHAYSEGGVLLQDAKHADELYAKACRLDPSWCD